MKYIADLHQHSKFSRATSKHSDLLSFHSAAMKKGITLVGTGDFTHPGWFGEISDQLVQTQDGLYALRPDLARTVSREGPGRGPVRFVLTAEISSIYKRGGRTRKVHNLIFAPDLAAAGRILRALDAVGNIRSDGRPILGLDSRDLLEIVLEASDRAFLVPAHIWTPWFSALGSKSGFDSIEECFGDLEKHIFAVETGLSSDPPMNWALSSLDRYTLISNSDSHSTPKMGREANLLDTELSFEGMREAMETRKGWQGTIEFFPEEGKYHLDGHRKCGMRMTPEETRAAGGLCPVCGKKVTVGVLSRIIDLADRPLGKKKPNAPDYKPLIPLAEIVGECMGRGPATKGVARVMDGLLARVGPELHILLEADLEEIKQHGSSLVAEAVRRMRRRDVIAEAGYDGEFGRIRLFGPGEIESLRGQGVLFSLPDAPKVRPRPKVRKEPDLLPGAFFTREETHTSDPTDDPLAGLDPQQRLAALHTGTPLAVVAGPGTGKTRTITHRIAHRIQSGEQAPEETLALTFTNRAARELRQRLDRLLGRDVARRVTAVTIHAFCLSLLREHADRTGRSAGFAVLNEEASEELFLSTGAAVCPGQTRRDIRGFRQEVSGMKRRLEGPADTTGEDPDLARVYEAYEKALQARDALDFDDLIFAAVLLLRHDPTLAREVRRRSPSVLVDEFQDLNAGQFSLLGLLGESDLCVIGDPDQSIYGFRGSEPGIFEKFTKAWPEAEVIHLSRNYRSSKKILKAGGRLISCAPDRLAGTVRSGISGPPVRCAVHATAKAEAEFVHHAVERLVGGLSHFSLDSGRVESETSQAGLSFSEIAVLGRTKQVLGPAAKALSRAGIPCHICGTDPWSSRQETAPLLTWLRERAGRDLDGEASSVEELLRGGAAALGTSPDELAPLLAVARVWGGDMSGFLDAVTMESEAETVQRSVERVSLLTIHAAKGLEFPVVFLVGCEDGLLPLDLEGGLRGDPAEERRLFYVAMTRAKDLLFLSRASRRTLFGKTLSKGPSPFLTEIGHDILKPASLAAGSKRRPKGGRQLSFFEV